MGGGGNLLECWGSDDESWASSGLQRVQCEEVCFTLSRVRG